MFRGTDEQLINALEVMAERGSLSAVMRSVAAEAAARLQASQKEG